MSKTVKTDQKETTPDKDSLCIDFHGAAIIDEDGNEIPITEEMVKQACQIVDPESD